MRWETDPDGSILHSTYSLGRDRDAHGGVRQLSTIALAQSRHSAHQDHDTTLSHSPSDLIRFDSSQNVVLRYCTGGVSTIIAQLIKIP